MARDYAKQSKKAPVKKQRDPFAKLWYLTAFAIIGFMGLLLFLKQRPMTMTPEPIEKVTSKKRASASQQTQGVAKTEKPRFEFYTMLPSSKAVDISKPAPEKKESEKSQAPAPAATKSAEHYILQVAAFKKYSDADQVRIDLTLKGFKVTLQKIQSNRETWTRVQVGPFSTLDAANEAKQKMSQVSYQAVVRKVS